VTYGAAATFTARPTTEAHAHVAAHDAERGAVRGDGAGAEHEDDCVHDDVDAG
jgi:hypothetical protein